MKRIKPIVIITLLFCFFLWSHVNRYVIRSVYAQAFQSIPIAFSGGSPGCTVLVPAATGKQVVVNNGVLVIPAFGTGLSVQFLASTDGGASGTACISAGVARNAITGFFVGAQVGTTATNPVIIPLNGNPAMVTPSGQGLIATISAGTGAQAVGGMITAIQQ
jgi:hypothetical protein